MKKYFSLILAMLFALSGCTSKKPSIAVRVGNPAQSFIADLSQKDSSYITKLLENKTWEDGTADCINDCMVIQGNKTLYYHSDCGTFNDTENEKSLSLSNEEKKRVNIILEQYIRLAISENKKPAPMIMVDGKLYQATDKESTALRCGIMDGEITSSVSENEIPSKDNQSNFGIGYGYQYGASETIEICIDGKWYIFARTK